MFCDNCGNELPDGAKFCNICGTALPEVVQQTNKEQDITVPNTSSISTNSQTAKYDLIDPEEQVIKTLGNGYGVNLLYGNAKKCFAILTDKRLYLEGALYSGSGSTLMKSTEKRVIDIEDITGTGFVYQKLSILTVILGIITLPILIGIIFLAKAFMGRKTMFVVEYAGGRIQFDANIVGIADVNDFHHQIRRVKDKSKRG